MTAARATARRSSLPGQFWGCAMSGARSCLAVDIFLTCAVRVASAATGAPSPRRRQQARGRHFPRLLPYRPARSATPTRRQETWLTSRRAPMPMRGRRRARRGVTARRRRPYPTPTRRRRRQAQLRRCRSLLELPCLRHPTPPFHGSLPVTNSWLYIPLLLDGAGLLSLPAKEAWRGYAPYV